MALFAAALAAYNGGAQQGGPPPAPEVGVITLATQVAELSTELPGRTSAYRIAEVRPQVDGIIRRRLFTEGAEVRAGRPSTKSTPRRTRPRCAAPRPRWPAPRRS
jgi:membrane fusion protein (multidrug efflux system)